MKKGSWLRPIKRDAMRIEGLTFTQRMRESVRSGKPITRVGFKREGKQIVAVKQ